MLILSTFFGSAFITYLSFIPLRNRVSPKESPKKVSAQPVRPLKITSDLHSSPSTNSIAKTPKDRSPKVIERKSPRSPISERKRQSKLSELESQISKLQDDLKKVKDQLVASELSKKEAQEDAEETKRQLAEVSLKLEDSQKKLSEVISSKEENVIDLQKSSEEKEREWESQIESVRQQHLIDSVALASALDEIQNLKLQLEKFTESSDSQDKKSETTNGELKSLKDKLAETLSLLESMKDELKESRESDAKAQKLVKETLIQLEAAKETVITLQSDIVQSSQAYDSVANELEQSRARVFYLEGVVNELNSELVKLKSVNSGDISSDRILPEDVSQLQMELQNSQSEMRHLKSALKDSDIRYNEERSHNIVQLGHAAELLENMKTQSSGREAELESNLKKASASIEELKANLMDKETELQGVLAENESLNTKLKKSRGSEREEELENEMKTLRDHLADLRASLMDKETQVQSMSEENEMLKMKISTRESNKGHEQNGEVATEVAAEVEASGAAEQDAMTKLGYMMEEVDKSNKKAARVVEQLEAAQAANTEMEAELRRLKVQSDQWRKAAEAAASMLSPGSNGKYVERTGSLPLDSKYSPVGGRHSSPYLDDYDEDSFKKKNGGVLKKFLWKKPQK